MRAGKARPIPTGARQQFGLAVLSPGRHKVSLGTRHCLGQQLLRNKALLFPQSSFITNSIAAIPQRKSCQLPPSTVPLLLWVPPVWQHTRDKQLLSCPDPASQGSQIPPLRTDSDCIRCIYTWEEPRYKLLTKAE